jgi:DNA-binding beta-propeller fold protein YncE
MRAGIPVGALPVIAAVLFLTVGCGPTDPSFHIDFPFYFLQDIDITGIPSDCGFLKAGGDGIASADSLYFVDFQTGTLRAKVDTQGYPIEDVGATAEGGYALALCGNFLFHVSNDIYTVHEPTVLSSYGRFILTDTASGSRYLYSVGSDGTITTINSLSWNVVATVQVPGLQDPVAAVITADGSAIFVADGSDDTVKRMSTSDLGEVTAECAVPGGVADLYAGEGDLIYAAPDSISAIWTIDTGTGQHYDTFSLTSPAVSVAATPDDHYIYAGFNGTGPSVINAQTSEVEATSSQFGTPYDMAVDGSGNRTILCSSLGKLIILTR